MSDLISREDALRFCYVEDLNIPGERWRPVSEYRKFIMALPSAQKKGEWMFDNDGYFYCSQCNIMPNYQTSTANFCPNCGADMREE